jgi:hypothetical protein
MGRGGGGYGAKGGGGGYEAEGELRRGRRIGLQGGGARGGCGAVRRGSGVTCLL